MKRQPTSAFAVSFTVAARAMALEIVPVFGIDVLALTLGGSGPRIVVDCELLVRGHLLGGDEREVRDPGLHGA
jgi:hypothetical protein